MPISYLKCQTQGLRKTVIGFYKELSDINARIIEIAKAHGLYYSDGYLTDDEGKRIWFWDKSEYGEFQEAVFKKTGINICHYYELSYSFNDDDVTFIENFYDVEIPEMDSALDKDGHLCIFNDEQGWRNYLLGWYFNDCRIDWNFNWEHEDSDGFRWQYNDWSQFNYHGYSEEDFDLTEEDIGKAGRPALNYEKVCSRCDKHADCALRKHMDVNGYTLHSAAQVLGEFIITGWNAFASYVDERLSEISNYACNHMG